MSINKNDNNLPRPNVKPRKNVQSLEEKIVEEGDARKRNEQRKGKSES